ncbi:Bcr/CflA family efflux MFS transporter [Parashewanella curva]|uniref:Bcr/CflA family efflux transporter n=1 Tax=Parashewanella curva TaxID=2338552 RepID=A0A3L8PZ61_9GAMM|nr:multidrug effflux MFS transporter [Parashewanella curva]RLV60756.1 Bcr/CflA family efflux MFS transporter [Parashewanella curva]
MSKVSLPILMLLVVFSPLAIDIYLPSMPTMAAEFSVSDSQIQSTLIIFLFAMGLGQLLIGPLVDKFGRRPVALVGACVYGLSSTLAALATHFDVLLLSRLLQGLAACATSIVAFTVVRDCFDTKQMAKIYSYLNGAICVIPALAPSFGGLLALQFGWRSTFVFMTVFAVIMLVVLSLKLKETKPEHTIIDGKLYHWERYLPILSEPRFMFYALCCMSCMAAILSYVAYSPIWLIGKLGVSELKFSALFGFNAVINIIACFAAPKIIQRLGNRPTVLVALGLLVATALLTFVLHHTSLAKIITPDLAFMLPMLGLCIGFAFLLGPATSMALSCFGSRAGTATALLGCIQMSGAAIIAGGLQHTSLQAPDAVALICFVLPALHLLIMARPNLKHWHYEQS